MPFEKQKSRLELAERLLESAEHSSEAEMRNSLSRMYYAVYHLAVALVGSMAHGEFSQALDEIEPNLGQRFERLQRLRVRSDYHPDSWKPSLVIAKAAEPDSVAGCKRRGSYTSSCWRLWMINQTIEQVRKQVDDTLRSAGLLVDARTLVEEFDDMTLVDIVLTDEARVEAAQKAVHLALAGKNAHITVRPQWQIERLEEPQVAYGANGSPRAAVLVPVILRSGDAVVSVTVAITKLAEMGLARILGREPDLSTVAELVVKNALRLGASSYWSPRESDYLEVASDSVADLARALRKTA